MGNASKELWSYSTGERGRNRVRAYQQRRDGKYYLEWTEPVIDPETETPVTVVDKKGKLKVKTRKRRPLMRGVTDPDVAKTNADELAAKFGKMQLSGMGCKIGPAVASAGQSGPTVSTIVDMYLEERTPRKKGSKQEHDFRAARIFKSLFGTKLAAQLDVRDWDRFIALRRTGKILTFKPVGNRQIEYDLKFMIAVLNWAASVNLDGAPLLDFNPWAPERRAQMVMPRELSPLRPGMSDEIRDGLIRHSPNWRFALALVLGRHTVSRNSSVRHLCWEDVDLTAGTIHWSRHSDKNGIDVTVPLSPAAVTALRTAPRGIGSAWVFPSETDPACPTSRHTFQTWMRRAKKRYLATIPEGDERIKMAKAMRGLAFHGEKRAGVRDARFRNLNPKIQEAIARTSHGTLRKIYDQVEVEDVRLAMQETGLLPDSGTQTAAAKWQQAVS